MDQVFGMIVTAWNGAIIILFILFIYWPSYHSNDGIIHPTTHGRKSTQSSWILFSPRIGRGLTCHLQPQPNHLCRGRTETPPKAAIHHDSVGSCSCSKHAWHKAHSVTWPSLGYRVKIASNSKCSRVPIQDASNMIESLVLTEYLQNSLHTE